MEFGEAGVYPAQIVMRMSLGPTIHVGIVAALLVLIYALKIKSPPQRPQQTLPGVMRSTRYTMGWDLGRS